MTKHLIVGAGFSGLPVAKKLKELGESFDIVDKNEGIGGLWYQGVYRDAHTISSKRVTEFPDYPMPAAYPDFPSRRQMQSYLDSYARRFELDGHMQLNTAVTNIRPAPDQDATHGWTVRLRQHGSEDTRRYRTVTLAIGHHWSPQPVSHPGRFDGEIIRTNAYSESRQLQGKRVLVVGYGNTGCDIAVDASRVGASASISMRSGAWFFPKLICGMPLAELPLLLPPWLQLDAVDRLIGRAVTGVAVGDLGRYGVPKPGFRPFDKHPIVNTDLINAIRHGRVQVRPDVARLDGHRVQFVDGTSDEFDTVVYATGYRIHFPMIDPQDCVLRFNDGRPVLFMQLAAPDHRGLFVPGLGQARTGGGPLFQESGYCVARMIAHETRSVDGLIADVRRLWSVRASQWPPLSRLIGIPLVAPADMRSQGFGEISRKLWLLRFVLDRIGAPDAPPFRHRVELEPNTRSAV